MPTRYLTATEVAESLQLNVESIYSLIATEGLPAAKICAQWRFDEDELRAWIAARSVNRQSVENSPLSHPSVNRHQVEI